ncbi:hypothetical protein MRX96_015468 [Rhipicephalus microplus]
MFQLLSPSGALVLASRFLKGTALTVVGALLLAGVLTWIARRVQWKTYKHLKSLPHREEQVPFQGLWIIFKSCSPPDSPVSFNSKTVMGTSISAQVNENSPYVAAVNRVGELFVERIMRPLLQIDFIYNFTASGREFRKCINVIHSFARKVIEERKKELEKAVKEGTLMLDSSSESELGVKKRRPFLDLLILEHLKNPKYITKEDVREEVDTFMFGGHDTTAMGISWALFLIGHHPREQQKIHNELDQIFGDDKERHVNFEDLRQMKYLECAIKESLRIYPSVPMITRKCEEPFEIGQKFALAEEKIVIGNILRHFTIRSLDQRDKVEIVSEIVLRPKGGLRIQFTPR